MKSIPTYIINLKRRPERKKHVLKEFEGRSEFSLTVVEGFEHTDGVLGLLHTIKNIFQKINSNDNEFVIIGEDDLEFTEHYSKEYLFESIEEAVKKGADILLGGVSSFDKALQVSDKIFWVENFSGLQFTVVFRKFFATLSEVTIDGFAAVDHKIASITNNIMLLYPFVAIQREFGYSDVTETNSQEGKITELFESSFNRLNLLSIVRKSYEKYTRTSCDWVNSQSYDELIIPTYIINLPERRERLDHIKQQFSDKPEFDIKIIEACKHKVGAFGLWLSIRKIIKMAIENKDEVIIICEDDHQFTKHYSREFMFKNIIEAYKEGACFLSGGTGRFENAIPITLNRFWVSHCLSTQFVVIYSSFYTKILEQYYDENIIADIAYSTMTSSKMILCPFISTQKDFGYSDVTSAHNEARDLASNMFTQSDLELKYLQSIYLKYQF